MHIQDRSLYEALLKDNPFCKQLPERCRDALLLQLCSEEFPGEPDQIYNLESSADRVAKRSHKNMQSIVPRGVYWLKHRSRMLLGIESLLLQWTDLEDLPTLRPAVWSSSFLQHVAGNAFCAPQFISWLVCGIALARG